MSRIFSALRRRVCSAGAVVLAFLAVIVLVCVGGFDGFDSEE